MTDECSSYHCYNLRQRVVPPILRKKQKKHNAAWSHPLCRASAIVKCVCNSPGLSGSTWLEEEPGSQCRIGVLCAGELGLPHSHDLPHRWPHALETGWMCHFASSCVFLLDTDSFTVKCLHCCLNCPVPSSRDGKTLRSLATTLILFFMWRICSVNSLKFCLGPLLGLIFQR